MSFDNLKHVVPEQRQTFEASMPSPWEDIACKNVEGAVKRLNPDALPGFPDQEGLLKKIGECQNELSGTELLNLYNASKTKYSEFAGKGQSDDVGTLRRRLSEGQSLDPNEVKELSLHRAALTNRERNYVDSAMEFPDNPFAARLSEKYRNNDPMTANEIATLRQLKSKRGSSTDSPFVMA